MLPACGCEYHAPFPSGQCYCPVRLVVVGWFTPWNRYRYRDWRPRNLQVSLSSGSDATDDYKGQSSSITSPFFAASALLSQCPGSLPRGKQAGHREERVKAPQPRLLPRKTASWPQWGMVAVLLSFLHSQFALLRHSGNLSLLPELLCLILRKNQRRRQRGKPSVSLQISKVQLLWGETVLYTQRYI